LSPRTSNFILCLPKRNDWHRNWRGFGYIVVEEQIALVDERTRKVEIVFPRWGE